MAKPDMPYGLFPWVVPPGTTPTGALAVDLATVFKWYWRVRAWTAYLAASFSATFAMSDGSTISITLGLTALETFDVLGPGMDELSLALASADSSPAGYRWISRGSPVVSGAVTLTDSVDTYSPYSFSPLYVSADGGTPSTARTLFAPGRSNPPYSDGYHHMTRDPSSGLFTPFLGPYGAPVWAGSGWGDLYAEGTTHGGAGFGANCIVRSTQQWIDGTDGDVLTTSQPVTVTGSMDGHAFSSPGFAQWFGQGSVSEGGSRLITSTAYGGDAAISLTITPLEYWTHAPRIDPGNPTYDATSGVIVNNPATGAPWTIAEIIGRHGP